MPIILKAETACQQTFSVKGQTVNIWGLEGHTATVRPQLLSWLRGGDRDLIQHPSRRCGRVPTNLDSGKQAAGLDPPWPALPPTTDQSLLASDPHSP